MPGPIKKRLVYILEGLAQMINCKACLCEGPGFDPQEYQPVTPVVLYLPTGLAGCSVDPGISCGGRKLARTPRVIKKKKKKKACIHVFHFNLFFLQGQII